MDQLARELSSTQLLEWAAFYRLEHEEQQQAALSQEAASMAQMRGRR